MTLSKFSKIVFNIIPQSIYTDTVWCPLQAAVKTCKGFTLSKILLDTGIYFVRMKKWRPSLRILRHGYQNWWKQAFVYFDGMYEYHLKKLTTKMYFLPQTKQTCPLQMTTNFVLGQVITVYCRESSETNTLWWGQCIICDVMQVEHIHLDVLYLGFNKFYVRISSYCRVTAV